ncbi:SH2 domain-containing protein 7-like [Anguilla rostrata]|uniref:SH2 domain-containing protein 7-like n=1 Tax=Anguilla rostrata TaxID=7938 RepID=UPI0030CEF01F
MEQQRSPVVEPQEGNLERRLRDLTLKWFTDTQAPLIARDGTVPPWFQGYISRKGQDRCRHFVITQNKSGQFAVSGDTETHDSLANLIEYYKSCPIEPFGEKLTTSCFQTPSSEVYDVVQVDLKDRPTVSMKAMKDMWSIRTPHHGPKHSPDHAPNNAPDHASDREFNCTPDRTPNCTPNHTPNRTPDRTPNRTPDRTPNPTLNHTPNRTPDRTPTRIPDCTPNRTADRTPSRTPYQDCPPALPPKTCNRRAAPTISYDLNTPPEEVKPTGGVVPAMGTVYSELNLETFRSVSLPILDNSQGMQHPYRQAAFNPPKLPSSPCKRATCQTYSLLDPREHSLQWAAQGLPSSSSLDKLNINPLYQTTWEDCQWVPHSCVPGPVEPRHPSGSQQDQDTYDQVPHEPPPARFLIDNTYELIPDQSFQGSSRTHPSISNTYELIQDQCLKDDLNSNTYETLNDLQPKHSESGLGIKVGPP